MDPYVPPRSEAKELAASACKHCAGTSFTHVDQRFPDFSYGRMFLDGWIRCVFAYAYGKVYDECDHCRARVFNKPTESAVVAMILTFGLAVGAFLGGFAILMWLA